MKKITAAITVVLNLALFSGIGFTAKAQHDFQEENRAIQCIAMNIYWETRASSLADAMSVSDVVLNRVNHRHFPNNVCDVVKQARLGPNGNPKLHQCQFSWWCDGRSDEPKNKTAWEKSRKYARDFWIHGRYIGITEGSTHYHANYVKPNWAPTMDRVARVGSHIFYRMKGK